MLGLLFSSYRLVSLSPMVRAARLPWDSELPLFAVAWFLGTWAPFALASLIDQRTSYLYYMVIVMPGLYVAATYLLSALWRLRRGWARAPAVICGLLVVAGVVLMYPFVPTF